MVRTIFLSSHGLVSCPACLRHVRVEGSVLEAVCPFCEGAVRDIGAVEGRRAASLLVGRSGSLVAALATAGLSLTVACSSPTSEDAQAAADPPTEVVEEGAAALVLEQAEANEQDAEPAQEEERADLVEGEEVQDQDGSAEQEESGDQEEIADPVVVESERPRPRPVYGLPPGDRERIRERDSYVDDIFGN
jgi:hypothetical protein